MTFLIIATLAAGIFAGAAIYVSTVEHPARVSCGTEIALREFAPSYRRGSIMQASLAPTPLRPSRPAQKWVFHQAQTEIDNSPNPAI